MRQATELQRSAGMIGSLLLERNDVPFCCLINSVFFFFVSSTQLNQQVKVNSTSAPFFAVSAGPQPCSQSLCHVHLALSFSQICGISVIFNDACRRPVHALRLN